MSKPQSRTRIGADEGVRPTSLRTDLLVAQRANRVYAGGAAGGYERRYKNNQREQSHYGDKRSWIARAHPGENRTGDAARGECQTNSQGDPRPDRQNPP